MIILLKPFNYYMVGLIFGSLFIHFVYINKLNLKLVTKFKV